MDQTEADSAKAAFDFWLGEWDCDIGGGQRATNSVTRILGDRVIRERFESRSLTGESYSVYNEKRGEWLQTWVDDQGSYLLFTGTRTVDAMTLVGRRPDGELNGMRMRWHGITADAFQWDYEQRQPDGTWTSQWHIDYRRRRS